MFELIQYIGALGEVIANFPTLDQCVTAAKEADYIADGLAYFACGVAV